MNERYNTSTNQANRVNYYYYYNIILLLFYLVNVTKNIVVHHLTLWKWKKREELVFQLLS